MSGLFDDPRFNFKFVALVEAHPCIYDTTHPEYPMSDRVDLAWQSVVDQLGQGVTIQDGKARWRNIRGRFTKFIKAYSEDTSTTPYYLASALRFVLPFMKNRVCLTDAQFEQIGTDGSSELTDNSYLFASSMALGEVEIIESSDESEFDQKPDVAVADCEVEIEEPMLVESQPRKRPSEPVVTTARKRPRPAQDPEPSSSRSDEGSGSMIDFDPQSMQRDCDVMFLLSLLPDFKSMNERQKRKFKAGVMNLTFDIMEES